MDYLDELAVNQAARNGGDGGYRQSLAARREDQLHSMMRRPMPEQPQGLAPSVMQTAQGANTMFSRFGMASPGTAASMKRSPFFDFN
jgi:hypothetical protein